MLRGLPASFLLHAAIIGAGFIVLPHTRAPLQAIEIVPVDIVTISEVTNVRTVVRTEKPPEEKVDDPPPPEPPLEDLLEDVDALPEDITQTAEEETPPPPPDKAQEQEPEDIVPEEVEEKKPEPKKEEPKPEPKKNEKPRDALDDLLNDNLFETEEQPLIDKAAKENSRTPPPPPPRQEPPKEQPAAEPQRGVGERTANEARVEALLWSKMAVCWGTVADLPDPERLAVTVRVRLKRDGTLDGEPELVSPRRAPIGDRFMGQAIERAMRAVRTCQAYQLPGDDYDVWREITMNFRHER